MNADFRERLAIVAAKRGGNNSGQTGQRQNVHRVVMEHGHHPVRLARADILEVNVRNQIAGQITFPHDTQDLLFKLNQPAVLEAKLPQPSCAIEKIKMAETSERRLQAIHPKTGLKQRLIVALAVVRDEDVEFFQMFLQRGEGAALLHVIPHEELADAEAFGRDASDADQKGVGS